MSRASTILAGRLALAHTFKVKIQGYYNGGFLGANGLGGELVTYEYREGGENTTPHQLPDYMKWKDLTLTKGNVINDSDMWHWFRTFFQLEGSMILKPAFHRNIQIVAFGNDGTTPIITFKVYKAFIKALDVGSFDSTTSTYLVNTFTIGHHGVDAEFPYSTEGFFDRGSAAEMALDEVTTIV